MACSKEHETSIPTQDPILEPDNPVVITDSTDTESSDTVPDVPIEPDPYLLSMSFKTIDNPVLIKTDVICEIKGDSIVECWLPGIQEDKYLIPSFDYYGSSVIMDGEEIISGVTPHNFRKPVVMTISSGEKHRQYEIYVHAYTGLPVIWIDTDNSEPITSKSKYQNAHFKLIEDVLTRSAGEIIETDVQIKGRGNTTWGRRMPKKPYRLKFYEKISILNEPKDKSWVMLANYADKTMLRNCVASYMGQISLLDYTPRFHFVELILNGSYNGTYQIGDKLKISKHRVNVGDDGFLLEIDARASSGDCSFTVEHLSNPVVIVDPDLKEGDANYNYVRDFVVMADKVLYASYYRDFDKGWQKYMDIDSFVDWYLINEIAKNNDASFYSSCYMNLSKGGKLKMGPIWDFDLGYGNTSTNGNDNPEGFWVKRATWYSRLMKDSVFVNRVKERFDYFYSRRDDIMREIDENALYLRYSIIENDAKWAKLSQHGDTWTSYMEEVQALKNWINHRMEWLKEEFDKMQ